MFDSTMYHTDINICISYIYVYIYMDNARFIQQTFIKFLLYGYNLKYHLLPALKELVIS